MTEQTYPTEHEDQHYISPYHPVWKQVWPDRQVLRVTRCHPDQEQAELNIQAPLPIYVEPGKPPAPTFTQEVVVPETVLPSGDMAGYGPKTKIAVLFSRDGAAVKQWKAKNP